MQLSAERLFERLRGDAPPAPAYFLHGDEPLQLAELGDAVRACARRAGILERRVFDAESGADFAAIESESNALSLFAERRLLEVRLGARSPDPRGAEVLERLAAGSGGDDVHLIIAGALDAKARKTRWFKALEQATVCVQTRTPRPDQLPAWLERRAVRYRRRLTAAAAALITERVEGNLLAAAQEIEKLCLLVEGETIDAEDIVHAVGDSARFDVFQLTEALVQGELPRALRVIRGLREEGHELPLLSWALGRELRQLAGMAGALGRGARMDQVLNEYRVWSSRQPQVRRVLERHDEQTLLGLVAYVNTIDAMAKGGRPGAPWDELEILALRMCGAPGAAALMAAP